MEIYSNQQVAEEYKDRSAIFSLAKVYMYFALGLVLTGLTAFGFPYLIKALGLRMEEYYIAITVSAIVLLPLSLAVSFSGIFSRKNAILITTLYVLYSIVMGCLLSSIFLVYDIQSIWYSLFVTAGAFVVMSLIGFITKGRMNGVATFLISAAITCLVLTVVNIFMRSAMIYWIVSFVMLFVVLLFVAIDTNRVRRMAETKMLSNSNILSVYCAYCLYSDFITLFMYVLRFIGVAKRD